MLIDPHDLAHDLDRLEDIEKASLRLVTQALYDFRETAVEIFRAEVDLVADIGEDITREALDRLGTSRIDQRLFSKVDYKAENGGAKELRSVTIAALPNGMLQARYNPTPEDTIWLAGRNAPTLGEEFRVRLKFSRLKRKMSWRVQYIPVSPTPFAWDN